METKTTDTNTEQAARHYRPIAFPYQRVPTHGLQRVLAAKLDGAPVRLWLALSALSNGHKREVTISNPELLKAARMSDPKSLRTARAALIEAKVLTATPADALRRAYRYDLEPLKQRKGQGSKRGTDDLPPEAWQDGSSWGDENENENGEI